MDQKIALLRQYLLLCRDPFFRPISIMTFESCNLFSLILVSLCPSPLMQIAPRSPKLSGELCG